MLSGRPYPKKWFFQYIEKGVFLPFMGTNMFMCKQSSDWILSFLDTFCKCFSLLPGILPRASVTLEMSGRTCGQTGPWFILSRTPDQCVGGRVGANLKETENFLKNEKWGYTSFKDLCNVLHISSTFIIKAVIACQGHEWIFWWKIKLIFDLRLQEIAKEISSKIYRFATCILCYM